MSPESAGLERYIGACLITQKKDGYHHRPVYPQGYGWAGGVPLISFTNQRRKTRCDSNPVNPLTQLAVHTQGAPLILTKAYHKKRPCKGTESQLTKVFDHSCKKVQKDAVSVASDESTSSQNSENCLPRIIKPRKRRKRERRPPHLTKPILQEDFSADGVSPDANISLALSCYPFTDKESPDITGCTDFFGDISETPKLHHSFEEVEEIKDINGNQQNSACQCRYCDPSSQIWDVDKNCYSPFLTPPLPFIFDVYPPNLPERGNYLAHSLSSLSLEDEDRKSQFSRSSSNSSFSRDLEVSTEIVTSLNNGHRDLEIKFFSTGVMNKCEKVTQCAVANKKEFIALEE